MNTPKPFRIVWSEKYYYGELKEYVDFGVIDWAEAEEIEFDEAHYIDYDWRCWEISGAYFPKKDSEKVGLFIGGATGSDWYMVDGEKEEVTRTSLDEFNPGDFPGFEKWYEEYYLPFLEQDPYDDVGW